MTATPPIRIRKENLAIARATARLDSDAALARAMQVHPSTVARTLSGDAEVGATFIAGLLGAFPGLGFEQLFEVTSESQVAEKVPA